MKLVINNYLYILENFENDEAKGFFEGNFSHVYFILHDCFVSAEANLRQRGNFSYDDTSSPNKILPKNFINNNFKHFFSFSANNTKNYLFTLVSKTK